MKTWEIIISGRVQGVGYRFFTLRTADRLGLNGTVRNLPSGQVEVRINCEQGTLSILLDELKLGPGLASVTDVFVNELPELTEYENFRITNTSISFYSILLYFLFFASSVFLL